MNTSRALDLLKSYSCSEYKIPADPQSAEILRQSIIYIVGLSNSQNLGICADRLEQGLLTLREYLKVLGYKSDQKYQSNIDDSSGVYIKYNTYRMSYLIEPYLGEYRGVLISLQSEDPKIAGTYGYFPLNLFNYNNCHL